jgi:hypothetical protein
MWCSGMSKHAKDAMSNEGMANTLPDRIVRLADRRDEHSSAATEMALAQLQQAICRQILKLRLGNIFVIEIDHGDDRTSGAPQTAHTRRYNSSSLPGREKRRAERIHGAESHFRHFLAYPALVLGFLSFQIEHQRHRSGCS